MMYAVKHADDRYMHLATIADFEKGSVLTKCKGGWEVTEAWRIGHGSDEMCPACFTLSKETK